MPAPKKGPRLGGSGSHQKHMLANLAKSLIEHERIETTEAKARQLRPFVEPLITKAKKGDLHSRRQALSYLQTRDAVVRLFDTVAPRYGERSGGYLRIIHAGFQRGDGADKVFLELVGAEHELDEKRQKRAEIRAKRREEVEKAMAEEKPEAQPSDEGGAES